MLGDHLRQFGYVPEFVRLSDYLSMLAKVESTDEFERTNALMNEGNSLRQQTGSDDIVALAALGAIAKRRQVDPALGSRKPAPRSALILHTLKHPEEARTLRRIYGPGFFLIGVHAPVERRKHYLMGVKGMTEEQAEKLIRRDEDEPANFGQKTRETFELSDLFLEEVGHEEELRRFVDLIFGHPYLTPTVDEHAMFLATASSLRSGQLGRQVGAAISTERGDVLAVGCNDVPRAGGGLYWPGAEDRRDHVLEYDSNERSRREIIDEVISKMTGSAEVGNRDELRSQLKATKLWHITEYGRAVHAEMDALLTCARNGVSPVGATHIEPYPKSRAMELHFDSITVDGQQGGDGPVDKIPFEPFIGIGPRRYLQLFSVSLGEGGNIVRKKDGIVVEWRREEAEPRVPMVPRSYLQQEQVGVNLFERKTARQREEDSDASPTPDVDNSAA
ncbi:MAG: cytidine deaminase [Acidobacteria bacterium]|nr:cytidine deaminase [Acidobacteriota bacterium]